MVDYSEFPDIIFGLRCSQHRTLRMKPVLVQFSVRGASSLTKIQMLRHLVALERRILYFQRTTITKWFGGDHERLSISQALRGLRGDGRDSIKRKCKGQIIPKPKFKKPSKRRGIQHNDVKTKTGLLQPSARAESEAETESENNITVQSLLTQCTVCWEALPATSFPADKLTTTCNHLQTACSACVKTSIESQIPDLAWDQVKCPDCPEILPFTVVKHWVSLELFDVYDKKSLVSVFSGLPNFAMCLGPGCGFGQIHALGDDEPIMTCEVRKFKICYVHKLPWHEGKTCAEYDADRQQVVEQDAASELYIQRHATVCPNPDCGIPISKRSGCDHMTCSHCQHEFCYICSADWGRIMAHGNTSHARTCRYHSRNIR